MRIRRMMLDPPVLCGHCKREKATELDHDPPLAMHRHIEGSGCCRYIPSCTDCNQTAGKLVEQGRWRPHMSVAGVELEPERDGLGPGDKRWRVPWLKGLRRPPADATWPRLMSVPHPAAVGSLGAEFVGWAEAREGRSLRWWQGLVAARLLEVDADGRLVWDAALVSVARQTGKSWLFRELCLWRIAQAARFGEPQDVIHTGKDLAICKEVQRPARYWAKAQPDVFKVREVNGQEEIELLENGSRWMLRAKEAVYGYSVSAAFVDEAWKVRVSSVDEGLVPTMAERNQPQLWLVSTAHRAATSLMLGRRQAALVELETGNGDLLIEWSAPQGADVDDRRAWRAASPHWTDRRERMVARQLQMSRDGDVQDQDEPDPIASFQSQWLNQWPRKLAEPDGPTEPLLPAGLWGELADEDVATSGPIYVAVEDDYGLGAAVAAAARGEDGRLELDGWLCPDWDAAIRDVQQLGGGRQIKRLLVGASMLDRVPPRTIPGPEPAAGTQTRVGLSLLRDLALNGMITHDVDTYELDDALGVAHVREAPTGLFLIARGPTHLVRAAVWALSAAHKPSKTPAIR